ncbi:hypothetical protein M3Y94_00030600 [Aphelenchoides besseyi]|nr:hypothetical protein M3Y94_00030600 [Aphelenchoides besseyi]KAI6218622.1 hypothetical protein M3Y95_01162200 [Aphelenchoides besseyi]
MSVARFLFLFVFVADASLFEYYHYNVVGSLKCNGEAYSNATIIFYEMDIGKNDLCAVVRSDSSGKFRSTAQEEDAFMYFVAPFLKPDDLHMHVVHNCSVEGPKCVERNLGTDIWQKGDIEPHVIAEMELAQATSTECDERVLWDLGLEHSEPTSCNMN